jgi:hypothetical protein
LRQGLFKTFIIQCKKVDINCRVVFKNQALVLTGSGSGSAPLVWIKMGAAKTLPKDQNLYPTGSGYGSATLVWSKRRAT